MNSRIHFGELLSVIITNGRLLEPDDSFRNFELKFGEKLILSCEGAGTIMHPNTIKDTPTLSPTCEGGDNFRNDEHLDSTFDLFRCTYAPLHVSRRTERKCYEGHIFMEVGDKVNNMFYIIYESYFDEVAFQGIYSKYTQRPYNAQHQTKVDRPLLYPTVFII